MAKVEKSSSPTFLQTGKGSGMQSRNGANTQTPGQTGRQYDGKGPDFAKGGPADGMHSRGTVTTRQCGTTGGQS